MNKYVAKQSGKFSIPQIKSYLLDLINVEMYCFKDDIWYFETEKKIEVDSFHPFLMIMDINNDTNSSVS